MADKIGAIELVEPSASELPGDDTALYRISGWALKSTIDVITKHLKQLQEAKPEIQQQLDLLSLLKRPSTNKDTLPIGAQYLDRGGLTFIHSLLLPWLQAIETSIKIFLNQDGYKKYGKDIFTVSWVVCIMYVLYLCII